MDSSSLFDILLIGAHGDDRDVTLTFLRKSFRNRIRVAADGASALEDLDGYAQGATDDGATLMVLLDWHVRMLDAGRVIDHMRATPGLRNARVVVLVDSELEKHSFARGPYSDTPCVVQPVDPSTLGDVLRATGVTMLLLAPTESVAVARGYR